MQKKITMKKKEKKNLVEKNPTKELLMPKLP
jgi:hypothetical protein